MSVAKENSSFIKDIVRDVGNYFSNRRIPTASSVTEEVEKTLDNAPIMLQHLSIINALPPIYDNIVDPPTETAKEDYQYNLTTLFNKEQKMDKASIGRAYTKHILASGNYLTLVPMEFDFSAFDAGKTMTDGILTNTIKDGINNTINAVKGSRANPASLWKSFNQAVDIGSFGYTTKVAGKRYWRHVAANMKAVIYALGIEYADGNNGLTHLPEMNNTLPDWLKDNILHNKFYNRWNMAVNNTGGSAVDLLSESDSEKYKELEAKRDEARKKENMPGFPNVSTDAKDHVYASTYQKQMDDILKNSGASQKFQEIERNISEANFYTNESIKKLRSWVMAVGNTEMVDLNLPFVTFYVNGIIEKNTSASQSIGESELGAILAGNFTMDMFKNLSNKKKGGAVTNTIKGLISDAANSAESLVKELSYVGNEDAAGYFSSGYVPRVNKGVDGDISYSISLRALADGSDPISIASHCMYTLALIMPFYVEPTHKAYKYSFVPKAPLICSAFCKGVFNIPKGCISSIDIKTDPVFQTTESVSTDIEINLTLVPFINKGFSPDFGTVFNATSDEHHIITAFFNPFSTLNVLITLCGMNTTMTKINEGLFAYFFWKKPTSVVNIAFESWEGFKSSFVDFSSTTVRNLGLARNVKAL